MAINRPGKTGGRLRTELACPFLVDCDRKVRVESCATHLFKEVLQYLLNGLPDWGRERLEDEFGRYATWVAEAVEGLRIDDPVPAACRGTGDPRLLERLTKMVGARPGMRFLDVAGDHARSLELTTDFPLPEPGHVRFQVRTSGADLTGDAPEDALQRGRHMLSPLYFAGQDVLTEIRLLSDAGGVRLS